MPLFPSLPPPPSRNVHRPVVTFSLFIRQRRVQAVALFCFFFFFLSALWTRSSRQDLKTEKPVALYFGPRPSNSENLGGEEHGFLPLLQAHDLCQHRRLKAYTTRDARRKVYDLFLFNTELDFLELRLNELNSSVDYFVILESPNTFQMNPKPLHLKENLPLFKDFENKIIHRVLNVTTSAAQSVPAGDTWEQERFTRNALFDQALMSLRGDQAPQQGDVLMVGDVDEIPRPSILTTLRNCAFPSRVTLRTQMYYYSYQWLHRGEEWHHPQATYFNGPKKTIRPESLRSDEADTELRMSGWHCSSCFATIADFQNKITSFSHKSYNQPYFLDTDRLLQVVRNGEDLFERHGEIYDRIDDNPDVPKYLQREDMKEKFKYMLNRDPINGNFEDV